MDTYSPVIQRQMSEHSQALRENAIRDALRRYRNWRKEKQTPYIKQQVQYAMNDLIRLGAYKPEDFPLTEE